MSITLYPTKGIVNGTHPIIT